MKKLVLVGILGVFGFGAALAQKPNEVNSEESYEYKVKGGDTLSYEAESETKMKTDSAEIKVEREVDKSSGKDKSAAGKAADEVGSAAKSAGKGIKKGAEWTADKAKHNKVTKEVFDQPGDIDKNDRAENNQAKADTIDATSRAKNTAEEAGNKLENAGEEAVDETEDALN